MITIKQATNSFLQDLGRRSPRTVETRRTGINHLLTYLNDNGTPAYSDVSRITTDELIGCVRWLASQDYADTSLGSYMATIGSFARFLVLEDYAEFSAADYERLRERMKNIRQAFPVRRLPDVPSDEAVMALQTQAHRQPQHTVRLALMRLRNIAIIETLRATGARVSEITGLRCKDLIANRKAAKVMGKGRRERLIWFDDPAWDSVQLYLDIRGDRENGSPVFARHDRSVKGIEPLSAWSVQSMIGKLAEEAGLEETITPHAFRHRFATKVLGRTGNLALTQDMMGHASPTTTRIYARITEETLCDERAKMGVI
jgi:integrase/recombinase XerD